MKRKKRNKMFDLLFELIKDTWLFPVLIIVIIMTVINIFSKFVDNLFGLVDNITKFVIYVYSGIKKILKKVFQIIFFPFTIITIVQKFKYFKSLIINNSKYKEII